MKNLDGVGLVLKDSQCRRRGLAVRRVDRFGRSSRIAERESTDASCGALERVRDRLPRLDITGVNDRLQPLNQLTRLVVEEAQDLGVQRLITAGIAGEMGKIDGSNGHDKIRIGN